MYLSLAETRSAIADGTTTMEAVTRHYLKTIQEKSDLNAFLEVFEEDVLQQSIAIDQKWKGGNVGRLAGMVIGLKGIRFQPQVKYFRDSSRFTLQP